MRRRLYLLRHAEVSYLGAEGQPIRPEKAALTERDRRRRAPWDSFWRV